MSRPRRLTTSSIRSGDFSVVTSFCMLVLLWKSPKSPKSSTPAVLPDVSSLMSIEAVVVYTLGVHSRYATPMPTHTATERSTHGQ